MAQERASAAVETHQSQVFAEIDPRLSNALIAANPELASARMALRAMEARARATGHRSPATLIAGLEEVPGGLDIRNAGSLRIDLEQELFGGRLRGAQRDLAASEVAIARASLTVTLRRLFTSLGREAVRLSGWSAISRRLDAEDALLSSAEASIRGQFAAGDARYVDVLRLRTERLRVQSERAGAFTEMFAARTAIVALTTPAIGLRDTAAVQLTQSIDSIARTSPSLQLAALPTADSLLAISGALEFASAQLSRAAATRRLTIAEQARQIRASVGAQRFASDNGKHAIGPAIGFATTLPFTAGAANRSRAQAAELELQAEEAEQRSSLASLRAAISVARARYEAARTRLSVFENALLRGAREERESALAAFRSGQLSLTELLDFERSLARAEIDRIRARIEAAEALGQLYQALEQGRSTPATSVQ